MSIDDVAIGERMRKARTAGRRVTQAEAGAMLNPPVSATTVGRMESGKHPPRPSTLAQWSKLFNTTPDDLLGWYE